MIERTKSPQKVLSYFVFWCVCIRACVCRVAEEAGGTTDFPKKSPYLFEKCIVLNVLSLYAYSKIFLPLYMLSHDPASVNMGLSADIFGAMKSIFRK